MLLKKKKAKQAEETTKVEFAPAPEAVAEAPQAVNAVDFDAPASSDVISETEPVPTVTAALIESEEPAPVIPAPTPVEPVAAAPAPAPEEPAPVPEPPKPVIIDTQTAVHDIIEGKMELSALDFTTGQAKEIALLCLEEKQFLARQLDASDVSQREVLKLWVEKNYGNLLLLNKEQRHADLVNVYLEHKFKEQMQKWTKENNDVSKDFSIERSYSGQQIINYNYATREGEAICYFDNGLGIPVRLKTQAAFRLKIINALWLVENLDVELKRADLSLTINLINTCIHNCMRDVVLTVIETKKLSYYDLPRFFTAIKDKLAVSLQAQFNKFGVLVMDADIKDISIINKVTEKFESQYYALAEVALVKEFENKLEAASLKLYEQKAMIHDKYPSFQTGMTEAEKDLALSRYLKRTGQEQELAAVDVITDVLPPKPHDPTALVTKAEIKKPVQPAAPVPKNSYRVAYGIVVALLIAIGAALTVLAILFQKTVIIGASVLGVGVVVAVVWGILWRFELKHGMSNSAKTTYEQKLAEYNKNLEEYMAQKND